VEHNDDTYEIRSFSSKGILFRCYRYFSRNFSEKTFSEEEAMSIQYVTDEQGEKIAVVVPIQEWEALLGRLEDDDSLSPEEASRADESWQEYVAGRTRTLSQVKKALLYERQD
jgi:PHD/YefM family antitoxin component YafN of YafNO toxin-antitoxin module